MGREYTAEFHNEEEKLIDEMFTLWTYAARVLELRIASYHWRCGNMAWFLTLPDLGVSTLVFGIGTWSWSPAWGSTGVADTCAVA